MKISEITNKAETLNEQGIDAKQEYAQASRLVNVYSNQLVHANRMLDEASRTDEEGRPVGDVASAQGAVLAAQTMLNAAKSRANEAERKLVEIEQQKRHAISEIDSYTEKEERNLATLKVLQSKRFGGTVNSFVDDLISRLNKGQQAKKILENGLGSDGSIKSYSQENIIPSYSEFADITFDEEKRSDNETVGSANTLTSKREADLALVKGFRLDEPATGTKINYTDESNIDVQQLDATVINGREIANQIADSNEYFNKPIIVSSDEFNAAANNSGIIMYRAISEGKDENGVYHSANYYCNSLMSSDSFEYSGTGLRNFGDGIYFQSNHTIEKGRIVDNNEVSAALRLVQNSYACYSDQKTNIIMATISADSNIGDYSAVVKKFNSLSEVEQVKYGGKGERGIAAFAISQGYDGLKTIDSYVDKTDILVLYNRSKLIVCEDIKRNYSFANISSLETKVNVHKSNEITPKRMTSKGNYTETEYTGIITINGQPQNISRRVYHNNNLDPDLIIPAGVARHINEPISNMDLMRNGNAPFIQIRDSNGNIGYTQVELHHLLGQETYHGSSFFGEHYSDGTIVEIGSNIHKKHYNAIHIWNGRKMSFRVDTLTKEKSIDSKKYESFRKQYWRDRAANIEKEK